MIRVERRDAAPPPVCDTRWLSRALSAMLAAAGLPDADVDLILVSEADQAALNERFLGCFGPTNILSFPEEDGRRLGTLFLSPETLRREACLYGQDESEHCLRLLAHGLAHLMGYDHGPEMDGLCDELYQAVCE